MKFSSDIKKIMLIIVKFQEKCLYHKIFFKTNCGIMHAWVPHPSPKGGGGGKVEAWGAGGWGGNKGLAGKKLFGKKYYSEVL